MPVLRKVESIPTQLAMNHLVPMMQDLQTLCCSNSEVEEGKERYACVRSRVVGRQCAVFVRKVVPIGTERDQVLQVILPWRLEDTSN